MLPRLYLVCVAIAAVVVAQPIGAEAAAAPATFSVPASVDYPPATWVPAASTNFTVADRTHDYPIDMVVIHDIEGSYSSAIKAFQDPNRHGSAHYIVGYSGQVWQMVLEKDIAWHAGNWDYNTRAIGIEHEGQAYIPGLYTTAEYKASAKLLASICSRYGVTINRSHVIGHSEVPDPFHPGLFGGDSHHTDQARTGTGPTTSIPPRPTRRRCPALPTWCWRRTPSPVTDPRP